MGTMNSTQPIAIQEIAYHRNGVSGEPFYAVTFTDPKQPEHTFLATVFPPDPLQDGPMEGEPDWTSSQGWHNPRIAVVAIDLLPSVTFAHNSWRGDNYMQALYAAILEHREF
jgi:hypothetical protein